VLHRESKQNKWNSKKPILHLKVQYILKLKIKWKIKNKYIKNQINKKQTTKLGEPKFCIKRLDNLKAAL